MISLVVCTRNRASQLKQSLDSFARIETDHDWELVLVDNGSTDDTAGVVAEFGKEFRGLLQMLHEPKPGVSRAKNRGWRAARGDTIALTDDDCYPQPDFIDRIADAIADPRIGYVGGRVLLFDPTDYPITIQEKNHWEEFPAGTFIPPGKIHGANFTIRREVLEGIGGFDPWLGPGTPLISEEVDVMARASALGWDGVYDPRIVVYHHHGRKSEADARKVMRGYDLGRGAYYLKGMLNPRVSAAYVAGWFRAIRHQNPLRTVTELRGAAMYSMQVGGDWFRRRAQPIDEERSER